MGLGRGGSKCPKVTGTGKVTGTISNKTMSLLAVYSPAKPQIKQMILDKINLKLLSALSFDTN